MSDGRVVMQAWLVEDEYPHTVGRVQVGERTLTVDWPTDIDDETQREDYILLYDGDTQVAEVANVFPGVVLDAPEEALALAVAFIVCFPEEVEAE